MSTELVFLPIDCLYPHPDNPRKELGDLTELSDSIKANGIYQNLTVVPGHYIGSEWHEDNYTIIIGHRRLAASKLAGLEKVPCVIASMDKQQQVRTMLLENMQRSDLTVYEQAQGFQMLLDFGATIEEIANKSGFSSTTVRRRIKMCELDQDKLKQISSERQLSLTDFDELAKIEDLEKRNKVLEKLGTADFAYALKDALRKQIIDKVWPEIKALLDNIKAKEIQNNETWSGHYEQFGKEIDLSVWNGDKKLIPEAPNKKIYYVAPSSFGTVRLYTKKPVEKAPKKTEKQIQRELRIKEAWDFVIEQSALMFEMRKEFIENLKVSAKNEATILRGLVYHSFLRTCSYYTGASTREVASCLGLNDEELYCHQKDYNVYKALDNISNEDLAKTVYMFFADKKDLLFIDTTDYSHRLFPEYEPNGRLLILYKWLELLGYEMSGIEKSLLNGTHQMYATWKEEDAALSQALS